MNTVIYATARQLQGALSGCMTDGDALIPDHATSVEWTEDENGLWNVEFQCEWPLKPTVRNWVEALARSQGLEHDELEVEVDVIQGPHMPENAYWTDTQADLDSRRPQDPGTEFGVWYRSSRDATETKGYHQMHIRGAWFGEPFAACKKGKYQDAIVIFRGREGVVYSAANEGFIPGLNEEQHERIAFIRGVLKYLAERADGCFGGQADGIGVMLDYALKA